MLIVLLVSGCGTSKTAEPPSESTVSSAESVTERRPETKPTQPADDRPIILAFGDSLTAGSGLPPGSGYPEMLQVELDKQGYQYRVVNAGVGGDTTGGGLSRLRSRAGAGGQQQGAPVWPQPASCRRSATMFW